MRRMVEVLRVLCDMSFWREFIALDQCDETRMMHKRVQSENSGKTGQTYFPKMKQSRYESGVRDFADYV